MKVLVFQHHPHEHPGLFRDLMDEHRVSWHPVELDAGEPIPSFDPYDMLLVMGGPQYTWEEDQFPWLKDEKHAIRQWVLEYKRPYLGICFGHQLLADALGGRVSMAARPEVGLTRITVTSRGRQDPVVGPAASYEVFQWHNAEVTELPTGAELLATNSTCPVQAFRVGEHAYGLQYHCEILRQSVEDWGTIDEYRQSLEEVFGSDGAADLLTSVYPKLPQLHDVAATQFRNMMRLANARAGSIGHAMPVFERNLP